MTNKIQLKSWLTGSVLFESEKEDNTVRDTVIEAVKEGADLRWADLRWADLQGADLRGADLRGADLQGADLRWAKWENIEIIRMAVFTGLYKYQVWSIIAKDGTKYIRMGCFFRSLAEWESDFWNNPNEFPNNGSEHSSIRLFAYETAKRWFEVVGE